MRSLPTNFWNFQTTEQAQESGPPEAEEGRVSSLPQAVVFKRLPQDAHAHSRRGEEAQVLVAHESFQAPAGTEEAWAAAHEIGDCFHELLLKFWAFSEIN